MARQIQKRTLETRARMVAVATEIVGEHGFAALRVEEVALRAGVAKGTFFAHFRDKDALMELLIGARIDAELDRIEVAVAPRSPEEIVDALMPLLAFMTCERYVFDLILRYSGAAAIEEIGAIATTFGRHLEVVASWLARGEFRRDLTPHLLAEGIQAFSVQAMALHFCALHSDEPMGSRLLTYLRAWLLPGS